MNLTEDDRHRLIEAEWDVEGKGMANVSYLASIRIVGTDRVGLMMEVSKVFTDEDVSVKSLTIKTTKTTAIFDVAIEVKGKEQLEKIIKRLMKLNDILEIERVAN
jgi:GTP pyrophosphokinase